MSSVAIVALGPSASSYLEATKRLGGRKALADTVWTINALGDVFQSDLIFHMDDVRIQEIRAKARPESNIARMLEWMKEDGPPIITSRTHIEYPRLIEFPLENVINDLGGLAYFNNTAAYAVAYAIYKKFDKIILFGMDFTYPNAHDAEKGRACVEFWLGFARCRGIDVRVAQASTLMDAREPFENKIYGYDTLNVLITKDLDGKLLVDFTEKTILPTADEVEYRYDHNRHPNTLVEESEEQPEIDQKE